MKVFFPSHCLSAKSGFIFGWKKEEENIFVASTVIYLPDKSVKLHTFCERAEQLSLRILGVWLNDSDECSVFGQQLTLTSMRTYACPVSMCLFSH